LHPIYSKKIGGPVGKQIRITGKRTCR
jgi:hypothetical protein